MKKENLIIIAVILIIISMILIVFLNKESKMCLKHSQNNNIDSKLCLYHFDRGYCECYLPYSKFIPTGEEE